jgi:hypothetical protein
MPPPKTHFQKKNTCFRISIPLGHARISPSDVHIFNMMGCRTLLLVGALALVTVGPALALDKPSSAPKQSPAKFVKLFLKPSKAETAVDFGAFVMSVSSPAPRCRVGGTLRISRQRSTIPTPFPLREWVDLIGPLCRPAWGLDGPCTKDLAPGPPEGVALPQGRYRCNSLVIWGTSCVATSSHIRHGRPVSKSVKEDPDHPGVTCQPTHFAGGSRAVALRPARLVPCGCLCTPLLARTA